MLSVFAGVRRRLSRPRIAKQTLDQRKRRLRSLVIESLELREVFAAFTAGNFAVVRVDNGATPLSNAATSVFIDEYSTSGTLIQSIAMPTSASGSNRAFTNSGTATSEGTLTRSADGSYLVLAGYAAVPGTASIAASSSATVERVIGRIAADGSIDTTTTTTSFSGNNVRGATSVDGTGFWSVGSGTGVVYTPFGGAGAGTVVANSVTSNRVPSVFGNQLYVSQNSGAFRLSTVGTGTPTTASNTISNLPGLPTASYSPYGYFFADLDSTVSGLDTLYIAADDADSIRKYSLVGGTWVLNNDIAVAGADYRYMTGIVSGSTVTLFVVRDNGATADTIVTLTDASGYNAIITADPTVIVTASSATTLGFRGIAMVPASTDSTPPLISSIDDGDSDNDVTVNQMLTYTVTFNEDIDGATVSAADFDNSGTAAITIGTITEIAGGVFTIQVTPTSAGTLTLRIPSSAIVSDIAGNNLAAPVLDNDTLTVGLANPTIAVTSGNAVYSNSTYVPTASVEGSTTPDPTLSFVFYSDAGGANTIPAPENVGSYFVRAFVSANAGNNAAQSAIASFQITPFALTGSVVVSDKIFDGTTVATILNRTLVGVFAGDSVAYSGGTAAFDSAAEGSNKVVSVVGLSLSGADVGNYTVNSTATTNASILAEAIVATRGVFYNGATGTNLGSSGAATNAIATDKVPLRPGEIASYANYTNYSRGLNGVIIDMNNLPAGTTAEQLLSNLQFAHWNGIDVEGFAALPGAAIPTVEILGASGLGGSSRVKITFPDNTLQNTWLRITVVAGLTTALTNNDVFYFGNVIGDFNVGNVSGARPRLRVNATDTGIVRSNQSTAANSASVSNIFDVNRDGRVDQEDVSIVRSNQRTAGIVAPISPPSLVPPPALAGLSSDVSPSPDPLLSDSGKKIVTTPIEQPLFRNETTSLPALTAVQFTTNQDKGAIGHVAVKNGEIEKVVTESLTDRLFSDPFTNF